MAQGDNLITAIDAENDPLLKEMRRRFQYAQDEWREIREEGRKDMRVVAGDPWDPKDKRQRIDAGRPALSLDEIGQYVNQLVNDVRQHQRAIQVTPVGEGSNDQTAQFRQDLIRQIEYHSKAQDAYTCGFENAVQRSYGFWRISSRYVSDRLPNEGELSPSLLDQELTIEPVVDPDTVLIDPDFRRPDGSDMQWAFDGYERWSVEDYRRQWPDAVVRDASPDLRKAYPSWFQKDSIQVAVYWAIETTPKTVYAADDEDGVSTVQEAEDEDHVPEHATRIRTIKVPKVIKRLTNGVEVLEEQEWPGSQIPLICNFGKILYVDEGGGTKRKILSLIRLARDPYMLYCYYRTCEAELVGMTPKFPYFVRRGSLKPKELDALKRSLSEPIAVVQVESATDQNGSPPEFPVRQPYEPPIQALEMGAESARRAIQAAMGSMPLPTQAQQNNEKSGVALEKIRDTTQQGTYHFIDHFESAITRTGVILEELIPHFYDTPRIVAVRKANGDVAQTGINGAQPKPQPSVLPESGPGGMDIAPADHNVTLSTGPSYASERVAADEFTDSLVQQLPGLTPVIGNQAAAKILGKAIKMRNLGPIGDEMSDIVSPPDPSGLPPQVTGIIQQLQSKVQQLEMLIQTDTHKIQAKGQADAAVATVKGQVDLKKAAIQGSIDAQIASEKNKTDLLREQMHDASTMTVGMAKVDAENTRSFFDAFIAKLAHDEGFKLHINKALHEAALAASDKTHSMVEMAHEHAHAHAMADKAHAQAVDLATTRAALAPQPPVNGTDVTAPTTETP